jgi:chemotaxis protein MotB
MPRRRPVELQINHERWLVSYSDFITLLFAFFVVMYSISQVNESKYRVLSDTLLDAFSENEQRSLKPIQVGDPSLNLDPNVIDLENQGQGEFSGDGAFDKTADLPQLADQFTEQFADLLSDDSVQIHSNEFWLEVELKASILFETADAEPSAEAEAIFADVAAILKDYDNPVQVEGFTDNVPINNTRYPSNWELSSARAAAVVKLLADNAVAPNRLSAVGYGEHQPIADNATEEGRNANRRVVLMIARERRERPHVRDKEAIDRAINPPLVEVSEPYPQPGLATPSADAGEDIAEALGVEALSVETAEDAAGADTTSSEPADRLAPVGDIKPVETKEGGLLFSSDPDLPRK